MSQEPGFFLHHSNDALRVQDPLVAILLRQSPISKNYKLLSVHFGGYGVDRLAIMMEEHTAALLNCIDTSLRASRESSEVVPGSIHSGDRIEPEQMSDRLSM